MIVEKVLVESVELTNATVVYYTTDVKRLAVITKATLSNTTSGAVMATIYITPPGASPDAANAIIWQQPVAGGATADLTPLANHVLAPAGESIQALAGADASLTFRVSGYERSIL